MDMTTTPVCATMDEVVASRLIALRQFTKYESCRADADAALTAGRWRFAVLSARAAVGFAIDVAVAAGGSAFRDEVRRRRRAEELQGAVSAQSESIVALLGTTPRTLNASEYVRSCWSAIDEVLLPMFRTVPKYFYAGDSGREHVRQRRSLLELAAALDIDTLYDRETAAQVLADDMAVCHTQGPGHVGDAGWPQAVLSSEDPSTGTST